MLCISTPFGWGGLPLAPAQAEVGSFRVHFVFTGQIIGGETEAITLESAQRTQQVHVES